jgi:hypothetical protein
VSSNKNFNLSLFDQNLSNLRSSSFFAISAHGKRSNIAPAAPPSDSQQQPDSLAPPSDDSAAASSWEPIEEPSLSADEYLPAREAAVAWQRLRRPMHQRSRPRAVIRRDDANDDDYEAPPPRWLYQIMVRFLDPEFIIEQFELSVLIFLYFY